jgi:hypothetical protein
MQELGLPAFGAMGVAEIVVRNYYGGTLWCSPQEKLRSAALRCRERGRLYGCQGAIPFSRESSCLSYKPGSWSTET